MLLGVLCWCHALSLDISPLVRTIWSQRRGILITAFVLVCFCSLAYGFETGLSTMPSPVTFIIQRVVGIVMMFIGVLCWSVALGVDVKGAFRGIIESRQKLIGVTLISTSFICAIAVMCIISYSNYYDMYADYQIALNWEQAVRENSFTVERASFSATQVAEASDGLVTVIDGFDGDQVVDEVVTYKNVLDIPKIEVKAYIGDGTSAYNLSRGVGRHIETVTVGEIGNCVVAGHASLTYNRILNRLNELELFDEFYAYDSWGMKHTYYVTERFVCSPDQISILDNTTDGKSTMTIYTCTEGGVRRFVVVGKEFTEESLAEYKESVVQGLVKRMRDLNSGLHIGNVYSLIDFRNTRYTRTNYELYVIRPWLDGDLAYSDVGMLNFGVALERGDTVDVAQD